MALKLAKGPFLAWVSINIQNTLEGITNIKTHLAKLYSSVEIEFGLWGWSHIPYSLLRLLLWFFYLLQSTFSAHVKCTADGRNSNVNIWFLAWLFNQILISPYFVALKIYICNYQYIVDITVLLVCFITVLETITKMYLKYF